VTTHGTIHEADPHDEIVMDPMTAGETLQRTAVAIADPAKVRHVGPRHVQRFSRPPEVIPWKARLRDATQGHPAAGNHTRCRKAPLAGNDTHMKFKEAELPLESMTWFRES